MFGGGGGLNPRKMKQMMKQMGIDVTEIEAEEVIIRTEDHDLVFDDAEVTKMDARGQETYQIVGEPTEQAHGELASADAGADADDADDTDEGIPQDDIDLVVARTGASEDDARAALEANDGDLAAAVSQLE
ncbi:nascent polypeptide-associated complex protein [Haloarchaeobius iranensis]|uniref:Nascent polypeptide-associated complex protein n=1 Tax=Haloarchaeobius iranensis TaxID=996166 RepID=A0A1G9YF72_9EURY|nr:nascent polypeptide-associated complex protein [Haloarchaeobius iranensis]SDN07858.1 Nascent polypeptide associated complex NAC [Haloarchaeobius iranensis]